MAKEYDRYHDGRGVMTNCYGDKFMKYENEREKGL